MRQKMEIIREIRVMEATSAAKQPRIVDLTETPGYGLLCEMSIAEVHTYYWSTQTWLLYMADVRPYTDNHRLRVELIGVGG